MTPTYLPALCGKPEIPKALTKPRRTLQDDLSDVWEWVVSRGVPQLFFNFHPKNASLCCGAHMEKLLASGWQPDDMDEFNN
jgi:hypothetical protein